MTNIKDYPKSFSHVGLTVPNIKETVKFYSEVMGCYVIMHSSTVKKETETAISKMCIDVFGNNWTEFEIAHLATSDGIGIELFSFQDGIKKLPNLVLLILDFFTFVYKIQILKNLLTK